MSIWECDICYRHFEVTNSRASDAVKKSSKKFCTKSCHNRYMKKVASKHVTNWVKKNGHPNHTKGYGLTTDGYIWIYVKGKPKNQIKLHRYLMEIYFGRELKEYEIVHHKDNNKLNNSLENLEILSISEHNKKHGHFSGDKRTDIWSNTEKKDCLSLSWEEFKSKHSRTKDAYIKMRSRLNHERR